jgi:curved DNA-binding protein CbpA
VTAVADRPDYYLILGIDERATAADLRAAYRRAARANHPDLHPHDPGATRRFIEIQQAYEILSDPHRRATYRRPIAGRPSPAEGAEGDSPRDRYRATTPGRPTATIDPDLLEAILLFRALARRAQIERRVHRLIRYLERL